MFVPFVFTMDVHPKTENFYLWFFFYYYSNACIENEWPIISHERYFKRFRCVEDGNAFGGESWRTHLSKYIDTDYLTTEKISSLITYPIMQDDEDSLISNYSSQFDCWVDLLKNDNSEFEKIIGHLLDQIIIDFGEKPKGILIYESLPKSLLKAAKDRSIPLVYQTVGAFRFPLTNFETGLSIINGYDADIVKSSYENFMLNTADTPMLSHKGILKLFVSDKFKMDIHNIDNEPEYDVGIIFNSPDGAFLLLAQEEYLSDQDMYSRAKKIYDKVLARERPGVNHMNALSDDSPSCFHFCCRCERIVGHMTKGIFDAMLAKRITHEYGSYIYHSFCNNGIEDSEKGVAPIEFVNFVVFGLSSPFPWQTDEDYLHLLLTDLTRNELYMRSFKHYTKSISKEDLEFYYMTDNRAYRLGDILHFISGCKPHEYGTYYCTDGLSRYFSETCVWTQGNYTAFEFDLVELITEPLTILVSLYDVLVDNNLSTPSQTIKCEVNGYDCGSITLISGMKFLHYSIPVEYITDKLNVTFTYSHLEKYNDDYSSIAYEWMCICKQSAQIPWSTMLNVSMQNSDLHKQNNALQNSINDLQAQIDILENNNDLIQANNSELQTQIQSIYNSRSWKLGNKIMKIASNIVKPKK